MTSDDGWLDEREQHAWRTFTDARARLVAALARELQRDSGLSAADYEILVRLSEAEGRRLRAFELGAVAGWEKSRLSHHLARMQQRGLVVKEQCGDSRYFDIVLTQHGLAVIEEAAPHHVAHVREWFVSAMTAQQLDALTDACQAIATRLGDGPCGTDQACDTDRADDTEPCAAGPDFEPRDAGPASEPCVAGPSEPCDTEPVGGAEATRAIRKTPSPE
jgi:DNA-binding MarR family transcriptional regulator